MRHNNHNRKFGREANERRALVRSLVRALIRDERVKTTEAKAKELRPYAEKLITRGRQATLASRRTLVAHLGGDRTLAQKIVDVIAPRFIGRPGGYTRIVKIAPRVSDGARMAIIEFVN